MNKQQLANKIWESANQMRSKIEANEYKDYILGFIFYKYLSEAEIKWLKENDYTDEDIKNLSEEDDDEVEYIRQNLGYFIEYNNLYLAWIEKGPKFDISDVTDALSAFNRLISKTHKNVFENIFHTLETGLSKLGDTSGARTKAISKLLYLIKDIPMDGKQDYDVLGFIYEYLISNFAANAGKKAGEFYTPHEVSLLMSEIIANHLKDKKEISIYDPTSGSGSLLINIGKSASKYIGHNNIKYYAQELKENTYNLTRMNLVMRGINASNIVTRNADTLENDWPITEYEALTVDAVVSNPPYSQKWDPTDKKTDPRYADYGLAPKSKADYAFLLHDLFHLKHDGIMAIVLPHGVLFRGGEEGEIRRNLIEKDKIETIIGLPANIFFGTGIPTIIMILRQKREDSDVLIIDASKGFIKDGKNNKLRACDVKKIVDVVSKRKDIHKYAKLVSKETIRENEYNLNIPRYVDSSEDAENFDIYASMFGGMPNNEVDKLNEYWTAFPTLRKELFENQDTHYLEFATEDVKTFIKSHRDILKFKNDFNLVFNGFKDYLKHELIQKSESINISQEENIISEDIFSRLKSISLIDKYEAYQLLDENWENISIDLEMIQTEGFNTVKVVDPNMIIRKKNGKEEEVQNGWIGRILPFELVQQNFLKDEYNCIKLKEQRLSEIPSKYEEVIENMTEDEKESEVLNEAKDAFVSKEVTNKLKELKVSDLTDEEIEFKKKLTIVDKLIKEEKTLKSEIKKETEKLHILTKKTIENLSDDNAKLLLEKKWIDVLVCNLSKLPDNVVNELINKVKVIQDKYSTTYYDIEKEIKETEKALSSMIDELDGDEFDMKGLNELKSLLIGE